MVALTDMAGVVVFVATEAVSQDGIVGNVTCVTVPEPPPPPLLEVPQERACVDAV